MQENIRVHVKSAPIVENQQKDAKMMGYGLNIWMGGYV
jgi:hypothetical protein